MKVPTGLPAECSPAEIADALLELLTQPRFRIAAVDAAAAIARDKPDETAAAALTGLGRFRRLTAVEAGGSRASGASLLAAPACSGLGRLHEAAKEGQGLPFRDVGEKFGIDLLDDRDRAHRELRSALRDVQTPCSRIRSVDFAVEQPFALEAAHDLRGHLDIRAGLRGQGDLRRPFPVFVQPPGAGEQHELDVGEIEGPERLGNATLPAQRGMPEEKSRAVVRLERHQRSARSTSAVSV
jgi:hypothetical protein